MLCEPNTYKLFSCCKVEREGSVLYSCSLVPVEVILYGKGIFLIAAYGRSDTDTRPPLLLSLV